MALEWYTEPFTFDDLVFWRGKVDLRPYNSASLRALRTLPSPLRSLLASGPAVSRPTEYLLRTPWRTWTPS